MVEVSRDNPDMLRSALLLVLSYLLGSLSGSLLLGRWRGVDIRQLGSGNAGGTNALRTQGWWFALGTVLIDVGKGVLAAWLAWRWAPLAQQSWLPYAAVLLAVVGHVWPLFHGLRGGKGAATLVGGLLIIWPFALAPLLLVWSLTLMLSGYVGLATVLAGFSLLATALITGADAIVLGFALLAALFIAFTHRGNLRRLRAGTEPRSERARILGRLFTGKTA